MSKCIFDFKKLMHTFIEICPDFMAEPDFKTATESRRFAEQVIFECSKEAHLAKHMGVDKTWRIRLDTHNAQGRRISPEVIITAHVRKTPPVYQPFVLDGCLKLTFKQASLLAVAKYCQMVPYLVERNQIVLTPFAGAVFTHNDIPRLALALGEPVDKTLMAVISSCQTDGYFLEHSRCYIALRALQKTIVDRSMRASLLMKTMRMYQLHGKDFDLPKYIIVCRFVRTDSNANTSSSAELDYLLNEIMTLGIVTASDPAPAVASNSKKPAMRCAANFSSKATK
ncbi:uncharacterized protein LOC133843542 [Drosophila sulfurigaster albostrigata]|uniref:uncharacterized protein LOC132789379 n=1 Tax=Drosophila nasuta TaxID=42062 RepID=UPI00295EBBAC|nr:uncharacterized protein LOC132789379 [Drosophila nasuta]XP_062133124.1 uncharacterized protein LOC133843542 [Drosophila sulfurigaster albostrigata]XP_062133125.1 uncharacterized protein LOC133843542 [Drosophila sulfurigaster albostrigata]